MDQGTTVEVGPDQQQINQGTTIETGPDQVQVNVGTTVELGPDSQGVPAEQLGTTVELPADRVRNNDNGVVDQTTVEPSADNNVGEIYFIQRVSLTWLVELLWDCEVIYV